MNTSKSILEKVNETREAEAKLKTDQEKIGFMLPNGKNICEMGPNELLDWYLFSMGAQVHDKDWAEAGPQIRKEIVERMS